MLPHTSEMIATHHVQELHRGAAAHRRARQVAAGTPARNRLGTLLIRTGTRLLGDAAATTSTTASSAATASGPSRPVQPAH
ncbi:MAG TPA: hypothetical protein VJ978_10160 [Nitriliruptoraceae bacterium]|nr:hypothetical protein [Nitriliruptoraceae bacterium]